MKKHMWAICYSVLLTAFTAYTALDTFVLKSAYQTDATQINTSMFDNTKTSEEWPSESETNENPSSETSASAKTESGSGTSESASGTSPVSEKHGRKRKESGSTSAETGTASAKNKNEHSESEASSESASEADSSANDSNSSGNNAEQNSSSEDMSQSGNDTSSEDRGQDNSSDSGENTASSAADAYHIGSYEDDNIRITLTGYRRNDTNIYAADVQLRSAEYLKTAFAENTYGRNITEKTSSMAAANGAVLAVNGDYYGARESGYVIRNGVVYRDTASDDDLLCIYADGRMEVISQSSCTANELVEKGVWQAFVFGPGLIENGNISVSENDEVGRAMASNPRTAIGITADGHYLFVVSDGRTDESAGLSLYELAEFMQSLGAQTAYNLDGGGSSAMYFNGQIINKPTTSGRIKEREVSDIVYIR